MKERIEVLTGELEATSSGVILGSSALGSCVAVAAYDRENKIGGLAHVMLPNYAPAHENVNTSKYAGNAINEMLDKMLSLQADIRDIEVCLAGGANVLKRPDDTVAKDNIDSIVEILRGKGLRIRAQAVGGATRRSISFDVELGSIFYTEGDGDPRLLWASEEREMRAWIREIEETKSELKRAKQALEKSEERLRNIFSNSAIGISMIPVSEDQVPSGKENMGYFNDAMTRIFGYDQRTLQSKAISELSHPEVHEKGH